MHINCRSIIPKMTEISLLIEQVPISILAVTETWLSDDPKGLVNIPGYCFLHQPRPGGMWGGVGLFIKNDISFEKIDLVGVKHQCYESLIVKISLPKSTDALIGVVYWPPGLCPRDFNKEWDQLNNLTKQSKQRYLVGDFNIDLLKSENHVPTDEFVSSLYSHLLLPLIYRPTRITSDSLTLIDNIFTSNWSKVLDSAIVISDISDHLPILTWVNIDLPRLEGSHKISREINGKKAYFRELLTEINWCSTYDACNIGYTNEAYNLFIDQVRSAYNLAFPVKKMGDKHRNSLKQPWMTFGLLKSCNKKI